jgi:hypothetical protein
MAEAELNARENLLLAARMTHNNEIIDVAEVLNETNDVIADATVQRANDITSHVVARRTALPSITWNKAGNGWNAGTALLQQARETIGMMKSRYQCPADVMKLQPDKEKFRSQQERPHIEAMGQEFANTLFGNWSAGTLTANPPEEFDSLSTRYPNLSTSADILSGAADASYVLDNGDSSATNDTSIWFIQWGPGKVYLITPRNSDGTGIKKESKPLTLTAGDNVTTTQGNQLWAHITEFSWDVGLCIEDYRSVKRLANIDSVQGQANSLNEDNVIQIRNNFKTPGTIYMYCNEHVFTQLEILAKDKANVRWSENNPFGKPQLYFQDMPIRRSDAITTAEGSLT